MSLVSILIPNYNKALYLRETLDSVLTQTYINWECIIVDDHSTDNSWEILEEYAQKDSRVRIFRRPEDRKAGGNAARNYAFEMSRGEFINWFDSDDIMHPDCLKEKVIVLNQSDFDFVIGNIKKFENNIEFAEAIPKLDLNRKNINFALRSFVGDYWVQTSLPMFTKSFLLNLKILFSEEIVRGQETEFFIRVFLKSDNFIFVKKSFCYWRLNENSKTYNFKKKNKKDRIQYEYDFFKLVVNRFKNERQLSDEELKYFKWYLNYLLYESKMGLRKHFEMISFGYKEIAFISPFLLMKILLIKIKNSLSIRCLFFA